MQRLLYSCLTRKLWLTLKQLHCQTQSKSNGEFRAFQQTRTVDLVLFWWCQHKTSVFARIYVLVWIANLGSCTPLKNGRKREKFAAGEVNVIEVDEGECLQSANRKSVERNEYTLGVFDREHVYGRRRTLWCSFVVYVLTLPACRPAYLPPQHGQILQWRNQPIVQNKEERKAGRTFLMDIIRNMCAWWRSWKERQLESGRKDLLPNMHPSVIVIINCIWQANMCRKLI